MNDDFALMMSKRLGQQPCPSEQVGALLSQLVQRCASDGQFTRLEPAMKNAVNVDEQDFERLHQ